MLERILQEVDCGGTIDASALAARLHTSAPMVEAMLDHLVRSGYLKEYIDCGDGCSGCSLQAACDPGQGRTALRLWRSIPQKSEQHPNQS